MALDTIRPLSPPRSVYIAFEAFPRPKGASSHIAAMVTALARTHAPVHLLCLGYADMPGYQREGAISIFRHRLYHPNLLIRAQDFGRFVHDHLAGLDPEPELCVFRDPWGGVPALAALSSAAMVFEVNALPRWELPVTYPAVQANAALRAKIEDMERWCLSAADRVIVVAERTRDALEEIGVPREKIDCVPNSADPRFFQADSRPVELDILDEGRWFGYLGSLHPWQGVDLLLDAWALAAPSLPSDIRLLLVHGGRREPLRAIRKRIRKKGLGHRVFLQSPLEVDRLAPVLARMAFLAAPLSETFRNVVQGCCPVKIVEAMAAGVPVAASDIEVCRALIQSGGNGLLIPAGKIRAWARALVRLWTDEPLRRRLAGEARRTAIERFTRPLMHQCLEQTFGRAAQAPPGEAAARPIGV